MILLLARASSDQLAGMDSVAYARPVASADNPFAVLDLPPGMTLTRGRGPDLAWGIERMSDAWLAAHTRPGTYSDPTECARRTGELAGTVIIGRRPVKADYRARWRYNPEEFDANGDPVRYD